MGSVWRAAEVSDVVSVALIGSVAPTLLAAAALVASLRNAKKIEEVHLATNSMKDELVRVTGESERAKGVIQGAQEEKDRNT